MGSSGPRADSLFPFNTEEASKKEPMGPKFVPRLTKDRLDLLITQLR